jgi:hypothetical protein
MQTRMIPAKLTLIVLTIGLLAGCIAAPKPDLSNPVHTVAILPFSNMSNNVDAPAKVRAILEQKLKDKFYQVIPLEEVDLTLLDELGITLGEQLEDVDFNEIASKIQADAFVFGDITHYDSTIAGALNTHRVSAKLRMIQVGTQTELWYTHFGAKSEFATGGLGSLMSLGSDIADSGDEGIQWITVQSEHQNGSLLDGLIVGVVLKAVGSALGVELNNETFAMINRSVASLRNGPGL